MNDKTKTPPRKRFSIDGTTDRIARFETVRRMISSDSIKASDSQVFDHVLRFFIEKSKIEVLNIEHYKALHEEWRKKNPYILEIINVSELPVVSFSKRAKLPSSKGIYFVYANNTLVYLGMSDNIKRRLYNHHLMNEFKSYGCTHITYYEHGSRSDISMSLEEIESELIIALKPKLNHKY